MPTMERQVVESLLLDRLEMQVRDLVAEIMHIGTVKFTIHTKWRGLLFCKAYFLCNLLLLPDAYLYMHLPR